MNIYLSNFKMNSGIGVGGFSTGKDETTSSQFDLFEKVEIETGVH